MTRKDEIKEMKTDNHLAINGHNFDFLLVLIEIKRIQYFLKITITNN